MTSIQSAIYGCASTSLSDAEKSFFKESNPVGLILFARNIDNPNQLKMLVDEFKVTISHDHPLILVDQEGGRVQRMTSPHWRKAPALGLFSDQDADYEAMAKKALDHNIRLLARDLVEVGINVDCLPLLDVIMDGADNIIGDRAFGSNPDIVSKYGKVVIDALLDEGVLPIIKHIPGHGRAMVDSHLDLPVVAATLEDLVETDFKPFKALSDAPLAMTAHIIYQAIDPDNCATQSSAVIQEIIRDHIGFSGLLMSDDLSMKALKGSMAERSLRSLEAGIDLLLHCNGDMAEMQDIASVARPLSIEQVEKLIAMHNQTNSGSDQSTDILLNDYHSLAETLGIEPQ